MDERVDAVERGAWPGVWWRVSRDFWKQKSIKTWRLGWAAACGGAHLAPARRIGASAGAKVGGPTLGGRLSGPDLIGAKPRSDICVRVTGMGRLDLWESW
jgi:hypothetical protein